MDSLIRLFDSVIYCYICPPDRMEKGEGKTRDSAVFTLDRSAAIALADWKEPWIRLLTNTLVCMYTYTLCFPFQPGKVQLDIRCRTPMKRDICDLGWSKYCLGLRALDAYFIDTEPKNSTSLVRERLHSWSNFKNVKLILLFFCFLENVIYVNIPLPVEI